MNDKRKQRKRERAIARRDASEKKRAMEKAVRERQKARQEVRDRVFAEAKRSYRGPERDFREDSNLSPEIKSVVLGRAKKLIDPQFRDPLYRLGHKTDWVREPEGWRPKGKSPYTQFRSLTKHLFVKYTMPEFMYSVFDGTTEDGVELFMRLGRGESLHKMVKAGQFPVPLTKRMCHTFMQSKSKLGFVEAIRHAQVLVHGGDRGLASIIASARQLRTTSTRQQEEFWDHVIQWTCNQPMLDRSQVHPIYDWVVVQRNRDVNFSMKGRTGTSVLRSVEEWHAELAKERKIHGHRYEASGFRSWEGERKVKLPEGGVRFEKHEVVEILTANALAAEGRAQKHCVYSYSWSIQRGRVSIWSYRVDDERVLTIEVSNEHRRVVQCRGHANRRPTQREMHYVEKWMAENAMSKATWVVCA